MLSRRAISALLTPAWYSLRIWPAFFAAVVDNFGDLIGQLFVNSAIGLGFKFTLGDGSRSAMRACAFGNRKTPGQVG